MNDIEFNQIYETIRDQLLKDGYIVVKEKRWVRPIPKDVVDYFLSKDQHPYMASEFYNYWDDRDWKRGKIRIKCFKRSANTWIKNNETNFGNPKKPQLDDESSNWAESLNA